MSKAPTYPGGIPGSITKGCRPRSVFLSHAKTIDALDRYVEWRYRRGHGVSLDRGEYRGLMPRTRLILTQKGGPFELSVKRRVNFDGETVEYLAADSLQSYVTSLYRAAGLGAGYSSHSGRRTFAPINSLSLRASDWQFVGQSRRSPLGCDMRAHCYRRPFAEDTGQRLRPTSKNAYFRPSVTLRPATTNVRTSKNCSRLLLRSPDVDAKPVVACCRIVAHRCYVSNVDVSGCTSAPPRAWNGAMATPFCVVIRT